MIALINTVCVGSTGKIITGLQNYLLSQGRDAVVCYGRGPKPISRKGYKFCTQIEVYIHYALERITGRMNCGSRWATYRLVHFLKKNKVKEVFLENLHGHYLNEEILLEYLSTSQTKVVYIIADETPYWGNCGYRKECRLNDTNNCVGCGRLKKWQRFLFGEVSYKNFLIKKKAYERMNAVFVAPAFVVESASKTPLLKGKHFEIMDEAIDVIIQQPRDTFSLRRELGIRDNQVVILCIAPYSDKRKGVKYFVEAARKFEHNNSFVFVQVGYNGNDRESLPSNYIPIGYVSNQEELSYYYSLGDLFVFPSQADTMPNACLEALSCGTPLLCFNVSGMPYIGDESVMTLVRLNDVDQMASVIKKTKQKGQAQISMCRNYALKRYDNRNYFIGLTNIMDRIS